MYGRKRLIVVSTEQCFRKKELKKCIVHYGEQGKTPANFNFSEGLAQEALSIDMSFKHGT